MKENLLKAKSMLLAIRIVNLYKYLRDVKQEYVISKQLLCTGTSIGANISEAIYAESHADFIHKYSISQKECSETGFWLELLYNTNYMKEDEFCSINEDCIEMQKLLASTLLSLKNHPQIPNT